MITHLAFHPKHCLTELGPLAPRSDCTVIQLHLGDPPLSLAGTFPLLLSMRFPRVTVFQTLNANVPYLVLSFYGEEIKEMRRRNVVRCMTSPQAGSTLADATKTLSGGYKRF